MVQTKVYIFAKYFHFLRLWRILGVQIWESAIKYPQRLSAASCQLQAVSYHLVPSSLPQKISPPLEATFSTKYFEKISY